MPYRLLLLFAVVLGLLSFQTGSGVGQEPYRPTITAKDIDANLTTDWYGLYLKGKKIGYFKTGRARADGQVVESFLMNMKLFSFGQKAEMMVTEEKRFADKAPYALESATFSQVSG